MTTPIRIALVGTGLFSEEAYLPAFNNLTSDLELVAVCSRSRENVERFAAAVPHKVEAVTDYNALLTRDDIEALCLVVPIASMPQMIEAGLAAKKHIISEKPATPNVDEGRKLLALSRDTVWMVAENYRYSESLQRAAEIVQSGKIGKPILTHWAYHISAHTGKYFATTWRTDNSFPGGFLLDGGVHHIAALRMILGEVDSVAAFTTQVHPNMPPTDTLTSAIRFDNGCLGSYTITYAANSPYEELGTIVGDQGALKVSSGWLDVSGVPGMSGKQQFGNNTVQAELADFAEAIRSGKTPRSTAEQGVQDVAILEAMLKSGETGSFIKPERFVR